MHDIITSAIAWHMGRWTDTTGRAKTKEFPEEYSAPQLVVHLADVIAAQKCIHLLHIEETQQ